ncbi:hypothetical protein OCAR_7509 [Afipia carboxidovorans OM5]|nr:hypothetical protein OCAR_7509 [Afipia carboxidovorans OM5]
MATAARDKTAAVNGQIYRAACRHGVATRFGSFHSDLTNAS